MRVRLRHARLGLYYAGRKHWVGNPDAALDLGSIEQAIEVGRNEDFERMEIVASFDGDSTCDFVVPLQARPAVTRVAESSEKPWTGGPPQERSGPEQARAS
jgi:hypothetical protein